MREVAALAGVSLKTVSRVVNREAGRVARRASPGSSGPCASSATGTTSRRATCGAANGSSAMVGALLQDVSNSFSASLLRSLEDAAPRPGRAPSSPPASTRSPSASAALVESLVRRRVDGLLLMPATAAPGLPRRRPAQRSADRLRGPASQRASTPTRSPSTTPSAHGWRWSTSSRTGTGASRSSATCPTIQTAADAATTGYLASAPRCAGRSRRALSATSLRSPEDAAAAGDPPARPPGSRRRPSSRRGTRWPSGRFAPCTSADSPVRVALVGFDDFPLADIVDPPLTVIRQNVAHDRRPRWPDGCSPASTATPPRPSTSCSPPSSSSAAPARSDLPRRPPGPLLVRGLRGPFTLPSERTHRAADRESAEVLALQRCRPTSAGTSRVCRVRVGRDRPDDRAGHRQRAHVPLAFGSVGACPCPGTPGCDC